MTIISVKNDIFNSEYILSLSGRLIVLIYSSSTKSIPATQKSNTVPLINVKLNILKGNFTQKLTPLFIILNDAPKSYGANKKNRIKKNVFWRRYGFLKIGYFRWFSVGPKLGPQNNFGDDVTWALLSKKDCFRGSYLHIEMDLNQKVLTLWENLFDLL